MKLDQTIFWAIIEDSINLKEINPSIFADYNVIILEISHREKSRQSLKYLEIKQ